METAQVNQQFNSSYGGQQFSVDVGVGYQFGYGDLRFGPEARLNYLTIGVDSFAEQTSNDGAGSAWAVRLDEQDTQSLTLSLSAQISYVLEQSWGTLQPRMALSWLHELKDNAPRVRGRFVEADDTPSSYFELVGDALDQNYFRLDLGLGARFNQGPSAVLQYRMLMGYDNLTEQSIMAELRWDF